MGRATIVSGGADGRYTVTLDYGTTLQDAIVAGLNSALVTLQNLKSQAEAQIIIADESEAAQQVKIDEAVEAYIEESSSLPPGSPYPDTSLIDAEMRELRRLQVAHVPLRQQLVKLKFEIADVTKRIASYSAIVAEVTKQVWCTTFYEDGAAASVVGTIDIPGDTNLTLIAPDCRAWNSAIDGDLRARGLCSPEQAYFNAAVFPGWQKFKPTYRWGTITDIDYDADTATVALATAESSAQSLDVNQASTLTGIAVEYMSCNAEAFEVGDRVVVQFSGQNWASQKVIGFVDNPRPCVIFPPVYIDVTLATTITANSGTRDFMRVYTDPTCSLPEATNAVARTLASKIEYDLTIGSPFIANPEDYDTVELAASVSGVVWSAVSHVQTETPNWTLGANTFPAIDAAFSTLATRPVSTTSIRVWTIDGTNTFDTIPSDYGPTCLPLTYSSGNYFVNNPFGNLLPMVTTFEDSIEVYLASLSSMPTITVELNGVSRAYAFTGPIYSPYSSTSWRLQYDPIPL